MISEIFEEICEMLDDDYTDDQIVGELLRLYQIETPEARDALTEAICQYMQDKCPF